jgi:hypothetical protein
MRPRLFFVLSHVFKVLSHGYTYRTTRFRSRVRGTGINYCTAFETTRNFSRKVGEALTRTRCCTVRSPLFVGYAAFVLRIVKLLSRGYFTLNRDRWALDTVFRFRRFRRVRQILVIFDFLFPPVLYWWSACSPKNFSRVGFFILIYVL